MPLLRLCPVSDEATMVALRSIAVRRVWGMSLSDESAHQGSYPGRISSFFYGKNANPGGFSADVMPVADPLPVAPSPSKAAFSFGSQFRDQVMSSVGFHVARLSLTGLPRFSVFGP